jgi:hypothetical protein
MNPLLRICETWPTKSLNGANAKVTEIKASHAAYISHAAEVAKVIEKAAVDVICSQQFC